MQTNYSNSQMPAFDRQSAYDFVDPNDKNGELYAELVKISEEIEQCRLRNC